jgi:endonuclease YncB( thermonuclease family)
MMGLCERSNCDRLLVKAGRTKTSAVVRKGAIPLLAALLLCVLGSSTVWAAKLTGQVVSIADGDTFTLLTPDHRQLRIRLAEIDAPESRQPWGARAKQALANLVFGKSVTVMTRGEDQYGRTLGRVYTAGRNVNAEMISSGAAWAYRQYLTDYSLISLETQAQKERRGLWALPEGQRSPPWEWRHHRGEQRPAEVISTASSGQCGLKRYCRQMTSCDEARFYLDRCGVSSLDGDRDGVPCEVMCR